MDDHEVPISSMRLRLSENAYNHVIAKLPIDRQPTAFLVGLCGSTLVGTTDGSEVVACIHTIAEEATIMGSMALDKIISWILEQEASPKSWPIVFHRVHHGGCEMMEYLREGLLSRGYDSILLVAISPTGEMSGHFYPNGERRVLDSILIPGSDIMLWVRECEVVQQTATGRAIRFEQSFGYKTRHMLSRLKIGVVGVSGTGSPVAEMLYRLGVGALVLVDGDLIEEKNIGRIYNSSMRDAEARRYKVDVIGDAFVANGLPTRVKKNASTMRNPAAIRELAQCDVIFGCMDNESGRMLLNRLCTYYLVPYFDLGVNLQADGEGGISVIAGAVHYLKPDGSSLLSRRAISLSNIEAEDLKRTHPEIYRRRREEKYIKGVDEERPAVITVNTQVASIALNDFLARIHPYRRIGNSEVGCIRLDLREPEILIEGDGEYDQSLSNMAGFADVDPLLGMQLFSEAAS